MGNFLRAMREGVSGWGQVFTDVTELVVREKEEQIFALHTDKGELYLSLVYVDEGWWISSTPTYIPTESYKLKFTDYEDAKQVLLFVGYSLDQEWDGAEGPVGIFNQVTPDWEKELLAPIDTCIWCGSSTEVGTHTATFCSNKSRLSLEDALNDATCMWCYKTHYGKCYTCPDCHKVYYTYPTEDCSSPRHSSEMECNVSHNRNDPDSEYHHRKW